MVDFGLKVEDGGLEGVVFRKGHEQFECSALNTGIKLEGGSLDQAITLYDCAKQNKRKGKLLS